jgi:fatty-acyl-CoA synthase
VDPPAPFPEISVDRVVTIGELLADAARGYDGDALIFPDVRLSYPELEAEAVRFARSLRALGVGRGDKVGLLMPNCAAYIVALFGVAKLGAVSVPINGRFKAFELGYVVEHADLRVLLMADRGPQQEEDFRIIGEIFPTLPSQDPAALDVAEAPQLRQIVDLGDGSRAGIMSRDAFGALADGVAEDEIAALSRRVAVRDTALLMYTSGTTSRPKGCMISHEAIVRQGQITAKRMLQIAAGDVLWDPLPMFHCAVMTPLMACVSARTALAHPGYFEPGAAIDMMERERATVIYVMFDTVWLPILDHPRFAEADLGSIRTVFMVGVPERMRSYQERTPWARVGSAFGMTECGAHLAVAPPDADDETRLTTAGHVQPEMEARIVHPETGEPLPAGEQGHLLYRGVFLFDGYYKQPELTEESFEDGWFKSGDLCRLDEQGRITYRGRVKDMLKVGGENVSALEVENYIATHAAVQIVQVVSAPDARYSEVPAAFIQLRSGAEVTEQEVVDFCLGQIATFKVPRYVRFVAEWPMSGTKIQKYVLRQIIADELEAKGITEAPRLDSRRAVTT